jgi:hypothetical protein
MKSTTNAIIWVLIIIVSVVAAFSVFADWASQTTTVSLLGSSTSSTESVSGLDIAGNDTFLSPDSDDEDPDWRIYVPYIDIALAALIIIAGAVCLAKGAKGAGWGAFSLILSIAGAGVTAAFALWDTFDSTPSSTPSRTRPRPSSARGSPSGASRSSSSSRWARSTPARRASETPSGAGLRPPPFLTVWHISVKSLWTDRPDNIFSRDERHIPSI